MSRKKHFTEDDRKKAQREATSRYRAKNPIANRKDAPISAERQRILNERAREWRAKNPKKSVTSVLKWQAKNPDRVKKTNERYRASHRVDAAKASAEWRENNRERFLEMVKRCSRRHYEENRNRLREEHKSWKLANRDAVKEISARRRAAIKYNGGTLSRGIVTRLFNCQGGICVYCDITLVNGFHLDHKTPLSRGGFNSDENVQLLCASCNLRKHTKTHDEFMVAA